MQKVLCVTLIDRFALYTRGYNVTYIHVCIPAYCDLARLQVFFFRIFYNELIFLETQTSLYQIIKSCH